MSGLCRAAFLDRDGTIIEDVGYPSDPDLVQLLPGALEGLRWLRDRGYALVVVSNQSGIGRGLIAPAQAAAVDRRFRAVLGDAGIELAAVEYCPHAPEDGCVCRKPAPGMLKKAIAELEIDTAASIMIGDKVSDVEAGEAAGVSGILLGGDDETVGAVGRRARDWPQVMEILELAEDATDD